MSHQTLKDQFDHKAVAIKNPHVIAVTVKLPSGAHEVIVNHEDIEGKIAYYSENYDADFRLKHNPKIQIVAFMLV